MVQPLPPRISALIGQLPAPSGSGASSRKERLNISASASSTSSPSVVWSARLPGMPLVWGTDPMNASRSVGLPWRLKNPLWLS